LDISLVEVQITFEGKRLILNFDENLEIGFLHTHKFKELLEKQKKKHNMQFRILLGCEPQIFLFFILDFYTLCYRCLIHSIPNFIKKEY
jgi:hypothetical protein